MDKNGKEATQKPLADAIKGGGSGDGSGPTGSSRSYPKGGGVNLAMIFNPHKVKACTWAVGGI